MEDTEAYGQLSQALNDLAMRIHSQRSFGEVLQAALDAFVASLGTEAGDIKLLDGDEWVVRYIHGFAPDVVGTRLDPVDAPVAARVRA